MGSADFSLSIAYYPDLHPVIGRLAIGTLLIICLKESYTLLIIFVCFRNLVQNYNEFLILWCSKTQ